MSEGRGKFVWRVLNKLAQTKASHLRNSMKEATSKELWQDNEVLVQVGIITQKEAVVSICMPEQRHYLRACISRFPGGKVHLPATETSPSTAYLKLLEAETRLGRMIQAGQTCVDLGCTPGGWSSVAVKRGAHVIGGETPHCQLSSLLDTSGQDSPSSGAAK